MGLHDSRADTGFGHVELLDHLGEAERVGGPRGSISGLRRWQHFEGVSTMELDGYTATAHTPHIHTHQRETGGRGWNLIQTGFFVDRLERRPEGWRIVHRRPEITFAVG